MSEGCHPVSSEETCGQHEDALSVDDMKFGSLSSKFWELSLESTSNKIRLKRGKKKTSHLKYRVCGLIILLIYGLIT